MRLCLRLSPTRGLTALREMKNYTLERNLVSLDAFTLDRGHRIINGFGLSNQKVKCEIAYLSFVKVGQNLDLSLAEMACFR